MTVPYVDTDWDWPRNSDTPTVFSGKADAAGSKLNPWGEQINALGDYVNERADDADASATQAGDHAQAAAERLADVQVAAAGAFAAAAYKGEWSTLTGPLAVPATVTHQGRLWYLKMGLADVTTQAPALGSAYWGEVARNEYTILPAPAGNTAAADRVLYRMTTGTSVLVLPAAPWHGMTVAAINTSGTLTPTINRNGKTICGDAENYVMNQLGWQIALQYDAPSGDWMWVGGVTAYTESVQLPAINLPNTWTAAQAFNGGITINGASPATTGAAQTWSAAQNFTGGLNMNGQAVVASGSNANGSFVRFGDGTQICWFITSSNNSPTWTYPATFSAQPVVTFMDAGPNQNTTNGLRITAISVSSATFLGALNVKHAMAIGRWF